MVMPLALQRVFARFPDDEIVIIGSAAYDYNNAGDVDVLFLKADEFLNAVKRYRLKYNGWEGKDSQGRKAHIRRANYRLRGIKPIQLLHHSTVTKAEDHTYCYRCRDGEIYNLGRKFDKRA